MEQGHTGAAREVDQLRIGLCLRSRQDLGLDVVADRRRLAQPPGQSEPWGATRFGLTEQTLLAELAQIRRQGFATRRSGYTGETISDDQLHAIAVPIHEEGPAIGALTICWLRTYMPPERFARQHLDRLQATAHAITQELKQPKAARS